MTHTRISFRTHYLQGLQSSIGSNSTAYGYSLVVTADYAVLSRFTSAPQETDIFLFLVGAVIAFAVIEIGAAKLMTRDARGEPKRAAVLAGAICIVSVTSAVGIAAGIGWLGISWLTWPLAAFASTTAYLVLNALEVAIAATWDDENGEDDEKRSDE